MRFLFCFAMAFLFAVPAAAQQVALQIRDGLVTLDANGVPARSILVEWGRVGGTHIVGADRITGAPLTIKLVDVPERQALDIILRNVAGFMAANRAPGGAPGASSYDRILILPTSSAPAASAANARATAPPPGVMNPNRGRVPPRPPNLPRPPDGVDMQAEEVEDPVEDTADTGMPNQPVFTFPSPPGQMPQNPVFVPVPNGGQAGTVTAPVITLQPNESGQPTIYNFVPTPGPQSAPATTPFGVVGAQTPGMIQQPAQPAAPAGTRPPPR